MADLVTTVAQAIAAISQAGLVAVVNYASSSTVAAGLIIPGSQSPAAGTVVKPGTQQAIVSFTVSTGVAQAVGNVTVPNVVGLFTQAAYQALQAVNLSVDRLTFVISSSPEGTVTAQSVTGTAPAGTVVKLTVSAGLAKAANTVTVPTVS